MTKALTCSASDWAKANGKNLEDYTLESVSTEAVSFRKSCDPADFPFVQGYAVLTDLKFRIIDDGEGMTVQYYSSATGLRRK